MIGLGVMIQALRGDCGGELVAAAVGKTITAVSLDEERNRLRVDTNGAPPFELFDNGQSCCEHRYMKTDDDLGSFIGATLLGVEVADGPAADEHGDQIDCQFLRLKTSTGDLTIANYNSHNGYYGGFWLQAVPAGGNDAA